MDILYLLLHRLSSILLSQEQGLKFCSNIRLRLNLNFGEYILYHNYFDFNLMSILTGLIESTFNTSLQNQVKQ